MKWQGKNVRIAYDPNDISFVAVWTLDGVFNRNKTHRL
jgi:hypothetical protein